MINLDMYTSEEVLPATTLVTIEGTARSGKGETGAAITSRLIESGLDVLSIDQGQKFRALTHLAIERGVDVGNSVELEGFLGESATYGAMLDLLGELSAMPKKDVKGLLYNDTVGSSVRELGKQRGAHQMAVETLFGQVKRAADEEVDFVVIDGRAMESYAAALHEERVGLHALSIYLRCDSFVAARRKLKDFRDLDEMPVADKLALVEEADHISRRNDDDASRSTDPMRPPRLTYGVDLLAGLPEDGPGLQTELRHIIEMGTVSADTSQATIPQMTDPFVRIVEHMAQHADELRKGWASELGSLGMQMLHEPMAVEA